MHMLSGWNLMERQRVDLWAPIAIVNVYLAPVFVDPYLDSVQSSISSSRISQVASSTGNHCVCLVYCPGWIRWSKASPPI